MLIQFNHPAESHMLRRVVIMKTCYDGGSLCVSGRSWFKTGHLDWQTSTVSYCASLNFAVGQKQKCSDKIPATSHLIMRRFWVNSLQFNQIFVTMPL